MCVALDKELLIAGYLNSKDLKSSFTVDDLIEYMRSLWNAGCGPVCPNFTKWELDSFLSSSKLFDKKDNSYVLNREQLSSVPYAYRLNQISEENRWKFILFCELEAKWNVPRNLLNATGYSFLFAQ